MQTDLADSQQAPDRSLPTLDEHRAQLRGIYNRHSQAWDDDLEVSELVE